jgi:hypothetical protein
MPNEKNPTPDEISLLEAASMDEIIDELKKRFPKGFLLTAAGRCECGRPDCDDGAIRSFCGGHPATILGLAALVEDEVKDAFRVKIEIDVDELEGED